MNEAKLQLEIARDTLVNALEEIRMLSDTLRDEGMFGTASRVDYYIVPHLENWIVDKDQIGSLASVEQEIEEDQGE